jgi:hypothetical protein
VREGLFTAGQVPGTFAVIATCCGGRLADTSAVFVAGPSSPKLDWRDLAAICAIAPIFGVHCERTKKENQSPTINDPPKRQIGFHAPWYANPMAVAALCILTSGLLLYGGNERARRGASAAISPLTQSSIQ